MKNVSTFIKRGELCMIVTCWPRLNTSFYLCHLRSNGLACRLHPLTAEAFTPISFSLVFLSSPGVIWAKILAREKPAWCTAEVLDDDIALYGLLKNLSPSELHPLRKLITDV